jgi:hypothetical protein
MTKPFKEMKAELVPLNQTRRLREVEGWALNSHRRDLWCMCLLSNSVSPSESHQKPTKVLG